MPNDLMPATPALDLVIDHHPLMAITVGETTGFSARHVCNILDIAHVKNVLERLDPDEHKTVAKLVPAEQVAGERQDAHLVNESGLYTP